MIISNAVPKAGGHFLFQYLAVCGRLAVEPGELYADIVLTSNGRVLRRPLGGTDKAIWGDHKLRRPADILGDFSCGTVVNAHVHDEVDLGGHRVAFLYRHPRNILVSAARHSLVNFNWMPDTEEPAHSVVRTALDTHIASTIARCMAFAGWLKSADTVVSFEELIDPSTGEAERVASEMGLNPLDPHVVMGDKAPWLTNDYRGTWSGRHSKWQDYWDGMLARKWAAAGGAYVEAQYGYDT